MESQTNDMTFTLRPYQINFISGIRNELRKHQHVLCCAATGSGKSKTFISIANSAIARGGTVLIISESRKIFKQISDEVQTEEIKAGVENFYIAPNKIYIAMAQTLSRRQTMINQFTAYGKKLLIINDEAHIGTATKLLEQLPDAILLGFTATPDYRVAKHLPRLYDSLVVGPQPEQLVNDGWLAPYKHFARVSADLSELIKKGGEFTEQSQEKAFESIKVFEGVEEDLRNMRYRKCLIFTSSIKHCEALYDRLSPHFNVVMIHSGISDEKTTHDLAQFTDGNILICISVGILTKGFDFPAIDLIMLNRATTSLALYLQMIGRASRIEDDKEGFVVVDYGGNYSRHGLWDAERDWATMWNKILKRINGGVAPVKYCPKCEYICSVNARVCPNCSYTFPVTEQMKKDGVLIEITGEYSKLVGKRISELSPQQLAVYAKLKGKGLFATRVAKAQDRIQPNFLSVFAKYMGYKNGWLYHQQLMSRPGDRIEFTDVILK
jgi:superfamily II DNA or RNA helicase